MLKEMTSAEANKMLRRLEDDKKYILDMEERSNTYIVTEGVKDVTIPEYDYEQCAKDIDDIDSKVRIIKHALNQFNCKTKLPESDITIDQALVMMAQLSNKRNKLDAMRKRLPRARKHGQFGVTSNIVEYECINYDLDKVKTDYESVVDQIAELQMGIDYCNQTKKFSVNIE